jgi:putative membrane protein
MAVPAHPLLTHPWGHHLVNLHLVLAGCLFTWAVAGPDPAPRRPGYGTRFAVLVLAAGAHAWLAKLLYAGAATLPALRGYPVAGSEQAAQLMYYGGDAAEVLLAVALFAAWSRTRRTVRQPAAPRHTAVSRVTTGRGLAT